MTFAEYSDYDALGLAELVRTKQVSPAELTETAIEHIETLNPKLNAVVYKYYERARSRTQNRLPTGRFHGVPFLLKDMLDLEDCLMTFGSVLLKDNKCTKTHPVIQRLEASGVNILGRTNMSELGLIPMTEPNLFGPTHNPWNVAHSPGGSSGGSAAAVAARMVPMAYASDGGGSIRIPASACGVFGLKPSRGRNPTALEDDPDGFIAHHVVTRSVRDSAVMLDATRGSRIEDRWHAQNPAESYEAMLQSDPKPMRIAFTVHDYVGAKAHPECVAAVEKTARLLESMGHEVEEACPEFNVDAYREGFKTLWAMSVGFFYNEVRRLVGDAPHVPAILRKMLQNKFLFHLIMHLPVPGVGHQPVEPLTRALGKLNAQLTPGDVWSAWTYMRQAEVAFNRFLQKYDALLSPVLAQPPMPTGSLNQHQSLDQIGEFCFAYAAYTPPTNTSGLPGMSVPLHWTADHLPVGSHFTTRWGREDLLFQLAGALERAQPWSDRRPEVAVTSAYAAPPAKVAQA